jgi:ribosomal protein S18 acetylase RimI-like enzyme
MTVRTRWFEARDLQAVVELSLRAWAPVFTSLRAQLGDPIFLRLYPDWSAGQAEAVRDTCMSPERDVFVAIEGDGRAVGFVAVALNVHHGRMGVVDMIAVDPEHQRRGIARTLMALASEHMRAAGIDIAVVETGGDPGHAPARATYGALGYTLLPIARYFKLLGE